jgi:hypothetical protein
LFAVEGKPAILGSSDFIWPHCLTDRLGFEKTGIFAEPSQGFHLLSSFDKEFNEFFSPKDHTWTCHS